MSDQLFYSGEEPIKMFSDLKPRLRDLIRNSTQRSIRRWIAFNMPNGLRLDLMASTDILTTAMQMHGLKTRAGLIEGMTGIKIGTAFSHSIEYTNTSESFRVIWCIAFNGFSPAATLQDMLNDLSDILTLGEDILYLNYSHEDKRLFNLYEVYPSPLGIRNVKSALEKMVRAGTVGEPDTPTKRLAAVLYESLVNFKIT